MKKRRRLEHHLLNIFLILFILFQSCKSSLEVHNQSDKFITVNQAAVVSAHPIASQIGIDILRQGGNAIDAAIAVQFALAVVYPAAGNIGGGGFMIIRLSDGTCHALDFREKAPSSAHRDMFLDSLGKPIIQASRLGHLAVGVPGTVDGMIEAYKKFSKLKDWAGLVNPSVEVARKGFEVSELQAKRLNKYANTIREANTSNNPFLKDEGWESGDSILQMQLSKVLEEVAANGREGFYSGWVADRLVADMAVNNGIITLDDLKKYHSVWRAPVISEYRNHKIISMPPPSSGGIALTQLLTMVEPYDLASYGFHSKEHVHLITEAERRVFADRSQHLGDSDFYNVQQEQLTSDAYNTSRMSGYNPKEASKSKNIESGSLNESEETTHVSIIDEFDNAVSLTTTINTAYGSKVVVEGAGFFLNNEMDDFSVKPGVPNYFGLLGNEANSIVPEKRMLSSMTPTIIEKDGNVKMIVGTPGGSTIITSVFQIILNILDFGLNANEATQACRFHHQWYPDSIYIEKKCFSDSLIQSLELMGHHIKERSDIGKVETILLRKDDVIEAAADKRGDDQAIGY